MKCNLLWLPLIMWGTAAIAQENTQIHITHLNPTGVPVQVGSQTIGTTPLDVPLSPGVNTVRVADREVCVYVRAGAKAQAVMSAGRIVSLTGAYTCAEAWSEVVVQSVPTAVTIGAESGVAEQRDSTVVIRVGTPGVVRLSMRGERYAPFSFSVDVGPRERYVYALRPGPVMPELLADTVLVTVAAAPVPPFPIKPSPSPVDPRPNLPGAETNLALVQSTGTHEAVARVGNVVLVAGVIASLVTGILWAKDSLNEDPKLLGYFGVSLGVTAGGLLLSWPTRATISRRGTRAGCPEPSRRGDCLRLMEARVTSLRLDSREYPSRLTAWQSDQERARVAYDASMAAHRAEVERWERFASQQREGNQRADENRRENERRLSAWRADVEGHQAFELLERVPRR